jgi:glycosyltransferase involved in cell wall biosynthesis
MMITHVVPRIQFGGGTQSILIEAREQIRRGKAIEHRIISLESQVATHLLHRLVKQRIRPYIAPSSEELKALFESSDIVVFHYWNTPSTYRLMQQVRGWKFRLIVYCRVNGITSPQKLPKILADECDLLILTNPCWAEQTNFINYEDVPALIFVPEPNTGYQPNSNNKICGLYAGTLNFFKMHPDFVALHDRLSANLCCIDLFGSGGHESVLKSQILAKNLTNLIDLKGFTQDMSSVYPRYDFLSYPLHPLSYASSDKVVQEAMWQGLPILTIGDCCMNRFVDSGKTGWIARDRMEYQEYLEIVVSDRSLRQIMGAAAKEKAKQYYHPSRNAIKLYNLYEKVMGKNPTFKAFPVCSPQEFLLETQGIEISKFASLKPISDFVTKELFDYACEGGYAHFAKEFPSDFLPIHELKEDN